MEEDTTTFPVAPYPDDGVFNSLYEAQYNYQPVYPDEKHQFPANNLVRREVLTLNADMLNTSPLAVVSQKVKPLLYGNSISINGNSNTQTLLFRDMKMNLFHQKRFVELLSKANLSTSFTYPEVLTDNVSIAFNVVCYLVVAPISTVDDDPILSDLITKGKARIIDMVVPSDNVVYFEQFALKPDEALFLHISYLSSTSYLKQIFSSTIVSEVADYLYVSWSADVSVLANSPVVTN